MTNVLHGIGEAFDTLPADALVAAAPMVRDVAERHGGRLAGQQLTVAVDRPAVTGDAAVAVIYGDPARLWSWREYGIDDHPIRPKRRRALAGSLDHPIMGPVIHPGIPADDAWTEAMDDVAVQFGGVVGRALDEAVS